MSPILSGDLVQCIKEGPWRGVLFLKDAPGPAYKEICKVLAVETHDYRPVADVYTFLTLEGYEQYGHYDNRQFRKIDPDKKADKNIVFTVVKKEVSVS